LKNAQVDFAELYDIFDELFHFGDERRPLDDRVHAMDYRYFNVHLNAKHMILCKRKK
jgi:hypothetical protein